MPDYRDQMRMNAPADEVFSYLSNPVNMPDYLPTVEHAERQSSNRIRVEGDADGHKYNSDGPFVVDQAARKMSWGSDGERDYRGELEVRGDSTSCEVIVKLHFADPKEAIERGDAEQRIKEGMRQTLEGIREQVESTVNK
jgi:uncharacterized membrane protein